MNQRFQIFADSGFGRPFGASWLTVRSEADVSVPVEMLIVGQIGKSWWDDSGVSEDEFRKALAAVPLAREVVVGINSQGGSVQAGLGIYNALRARSAAGGKVKTRNDGYAASIASVILCAGDECISPKTAAVMIHDPWAMVVGNSEDMEKARRMLEANAELLIAAYARKMTKASAEEIRAAMKAETWYTGETAKAAGLIDTLTDSEPDLETVAASFDPEAHPRAPHHLRTIWNLSGRRPANQKDDTMNRSEIIALLKRHGVNIAADATNEALLAALNKLVEGGTVTAAQRDELTRNPQPAPAAAANGDIESLRSSITSLTAIVNAQQATIEAQRRTRIEASVDQAIRERRIPVAQRDSWVTRGLADEGVLADIAALAPSIPGGSPVIEIVSESPNDVLRGIENMRAPMDAVCRGQRVSMADIQRASVSIAQAFAQHRSKLTGVFAATTITISSDVKRVVVLQNAIAEFRRHVVPLSRFSTIFQNVPLEGTDEIAVPFWPVHSTASTDWNASNGYVFGQTRTVNAIKVTVNKRKYQPFSFTSTEASRQPVFDLMRFVAQSVEQLGIDVFQDVLSVVTDANYSTAWKTEPAETFTSDDLADIAGLADVNDWPDVGRTLMLDSTYKTALLKDPDLKYVERSGSDSVIRQGSLGALYGLSDIYVSNRIPSNSENLKGFICLPTGIVVATSPIMPKAGVRKQLVTYDVITDPETGISFEYRYWGDADKDEDRETVECNYGYVKGDPKALKRIVSA